METIARTVNTILEQASSQPRTNTQSNRDELLKSWKERICANIHNIPHVWDTVNIPKRFQGNSIHDFRYDKNELQKLVKSIRSGNGATLVGDCGTGKTHLAIGLMYEWLEQNIVLSFPEYSDSDVPQIDWKRTGVPKFLISAEMFLEIKDSFNGRYTDRTEESILSKYANCPFLILDDLGVEKNTDWTRQDLYILINRRYINKLPTVITCNVGLNAIAQQIDDRIASRLSGIGIVMEIKGADARVAGNN